jgi:hypothetical protein
MMQIRPRRYHQQLRAIPRLSRHRPQRHASEALKAVSASLHERTRPKLLNAAKRHLIAPNVRLGRRPDNHFRRTRRCGYPRICLQQNPRCFLAAYLSRRSGWHLLMASVARCPFLDSEMAVDSFLGALGCNPSHQAV